MSLIKEMVKLYKNDIKDAAEDIARKLPSDRLRLPKASMRKREYYLIPKDANVICGNSTIISLLEENLTYKQFKAIEMDEGKENPSRNDINLILNWIMKLYIHNKEKISSLEIHKYDSCLQKYLAFNEGNETIIDSNSMKLKTAVDICSALNLFCNLFYEEGKTKDSYSKPEEAFNAFLENYKQKIRIFVRSRTISFYARSLEDICATYCIFNCKTSETYKKMLKGFTKVKQSESTVSKTIKATPEIRENILKYMHLDEEKFIIKMSRIIKENPRNFQIVRYKEVVDKSLNYFHEEKLIKNELVKKIKQELFNENGEIVSPLLLETRMALLSQVLNTDSVIDDYVDLFAILNENKQIPHAEATVAFLRSLIILHYYQKMDIKVLKVGETVEDKMKITLEKVNDKLTSLWLTPITYDRNTATKWFEFDWGFGRMVENELAK